MLVTLAALDTYPILGTLPHLSSFSRLGPTTSLPRNAAAPVSGVICLLTDEEVPSLAARTLAQVVDSACFREC